MADMPRKQKTISRAKATIMAMMPITTLVVMIFPPISFLLHDWRPSQMFPAGETPSHFACIL